MISLSEFLGEELYRLTVKDQMFLRRHPGYRHHLDGVNIEGDLRVHRDAPVTPPVQTGRDGHLRPCLVVVTLHHRHWGHELTPWGWGVSKSSWVMEIFEKST